MYSFLSSSFASCSNFSFKNPSYLSEENRPHFSRVPIAESEALISVSVLVGLYGGGVGDGVGVGLGVEVGGTGAVAVIPVRVQVIVFVAATIN